jgi:putative addiction module component (TIGR02574 family)
MKIKDLDKYTNAEKILLAQELWESVSKEKLELSDAMKQELDRRISLVEENKTDFYTWEDVKNTLKKIEMHKLVFSKEALLDIEQIAIWYEEQREGLSFDFELCLEESVSQIFEIPNFFRLDIKT